MRRIARNVRSSLFLSLLAAVVVGLPDPAIASAPSRTAGSQPITIDLPGAAAVGVLGSHSEPAAAPARAQASGPNASSASAPARARPYSMDLLRRGDFVSQTNGVQCVGASIQMMLNIVGATNDRTASQQLRLQKIARSLSSAPGDPPRPAGRVRRGASSRGWASTLEKYGVGPYFLRSEGSMQAALKVAARAMRLTGKPVGLLMWRGRHAWVMTGFRATADPLATDDYRVTTVTVADPWYPRVSSIWGRSPAPGTRLNLKQLATDFKPISRRRNYGGRYLLVLPLVPLQPASMRLA
jgi:hypothetical protein